MTPITQIYIRPIATDRAGRIHKTIDGQRQFIVEICYSADSKKRKQEFWGDKESIVKLVESL